MRIRVLVMVVVMMMMMLLLGRGDGGFSIVGRDGRRGRGGDGGGLQIHGFPVRRLVDEREFDRMRKRPFQQIVVIAGEDFHVER